MILTQEFLASTQVCAEGQVVADTGNYIGMDYDEVIRDLLLKGDKLSAGWLLAQKSTEAYVRANGSIFTMGAYQVFNPLTGQHTRFETEAEAKAGLVEIARAVLNQHCPNVVQELSNENGDTTWVPTDIHNTLVIS